MTVHVLDFPQDDKQDAIVTIRMTHQEREELNQECNRANLSVNQVCRALLGLPADLSPEYVGSTRTAGR